ncbi:Aste57867_10280 [Aphanomyces stellatus]|uniref:Aste57867_10280 protein n=1 Tax=Aphanomyces stellatus TaxID=120398 RepID=A0A485KQR2_9STRA|nr:hypothetical protein As57867_010240 [Aphanomyces stellatus]VFT87154.1 Aste57867_10280 [Aphanomyces stellatus]
MSPIKPTSATPLTPYLVLPNVRFQDAATTAGPAYRVHLTKAPATLVSISITCQHTQWFCNVTRFQDHGRAGANDAVHSAAVVLGALEDALLQASGLHRGIHATVSFSKHRRSRAQLVLMFQPCGARCAMYAFEMTPAPHYYDNVLTHCRCDEDTHQQPPQKPALTNRRQMDLSHRCNYIGSRAETNQGAACLGCIADDFTMWVPRDCDCEAAKSMQVEMAAIRLDLDALQTRMLAKPKWKAAALVQTKIYAKECQDLNAMHSSSARPSNGIVSRDAGSIAPKQACPTIVGKLKQERVVGTQQVDGQGIEFQTLEGKSPTHLRPIMETAEPTEERHNQWNPVEDASTTKDPSFTFPIARPIVTRFGLLSEAVGQSTPTPQSDSLAGMTISDATKKHNWNQWPSKVDARRQTAIAQETLYMGHFKTPLPPGWEAKLSRKNGQVYYTHKGLKLSQWDRPSMKTVNLKKDSSTQTKPTGRCTHG